MTKTYDAKQISIIVGSQPLAGFADDSKVTVERTNDAFTMTAGVDGEVTRSKSNDKTGSVTIMLKQTSESNDYLSDLAIADEIGNTGVVPILIKDNNGTTLHAAPEAWIRKMPNDEHAREAGEREWIFDCAELSMYPGSN